MGSVKNNEGVCHITHLGPLLVSRPGKSTGRAPVRLYSPKFF